MSAKPILAVDVDGVLNACGRGSNPPRGWEDTRVLGFRIRYNRTHGRRLLDIAEATGAELVWCTTWEALAVEHIAPLVGLPEMPWVPTGRDDLTTIGCLKATALAAWAGDRPFCWLDDEPDATAELKSHPVPHLVVRVDSRSGLQDHHFRRAAEWLAALTADRETEKD
jgi:hypothetical protein